MKIQINTNNIIEGNNRLEEYYKEELEKSYGHYETKITRIEAHFGEQTDKKFAHENNRCLLEFRLEKLDPIAVTAHADSTEKAFRDAVHKGTKLLITTFEKQRNY